MGLCVCSMFCCAVLCVLSSFAIIFTGGGGGGGGGGWRERIGCFRPDFFYKLIYGIFFSDLGSGGRKK